MDRNGSSHRGLLVAVVVELPAVAVVLPHVVAGLGLAVDKVLVEPPAQRGTVLHLALVLGTVSQL